jgi:hypothetical protein
MPLQETRPQMYDGQGDALMEMEHEELADHITVMPDALPTKTPDQTPRIRIMWGQHLLEDLLAGRYRTLVCAVNAEDNSRGIIAQLATLLPTSQWDEGSITAYAKQFAQQGQRVKVLKYDMDMVEVLAVLRPARSEHLTIDQLGEAFQIVADMLQRKPGRTPSASVSFLGARANKLLDSNAREPSFETVLRTMYERGYTGDVYPSPAMWHFGKIALFPRYPFSPALDRMRDGGF